MTRLLKLISIELPLARILWAILDAHFLLFLQAILIKRGDNGIKILAFQPRWLEMLKKCTLKLCLQLQVYSPETDSWSFKQPMPFPQRSIAASTLNGRIYVIGKSNRNFASYVYYVNRLICVNFKFRF